MVFPPIGHSVILHKRQHVFLSIGTLDSVFQRYWYVLIIYMVDYFGKCNKLCLLVFLIKYNT